MFDDYLLKLGVLLDTMTGLVVLQQLCSATTSQSAGLRICVHMCICRSETYQDLEKEVYRAIGAMSPLQSNTNFKSSN